MKKLLSIVLAVAMMVSMFAVIPVMAEETTAPADTTTLGDYYKFTFGADGDQYNYTVANSIIGDETGKATYKDKDFYPFLLTGGSGDTSSQYKTISTADGATYDVLEIKSAGNGFIVPLTKEGKPFEMTPGVKYSVNVKFFNPVCNAWGQIMLGAGTTNGKAPNYSKEVNAYTWTGGNYTATKKPNSAAMPFRSNGGYGTVGGNSFAIFAKEGTYDTAATLTCMHEQFSTEEAPIECTHGKKTFVVYKDVTETIGIPAEAATYDEERNTYDTKWSYVDETPDDNSDDVYVEGNNYLTLSFGGGNVTTYAANPNVPLYSNATVEEINEIGTQSIWQIVSIEVISENFQSSLSYSVNGEIVKTVEDKAGIALEAFTPVVPEGKIFNGWYWDEEFTVPFTSETLDFGRNTVYAKFVDPIGYSYSLELDFEDGSYPSTAIYYDEAGTTWPLIGYSYKGSSYNSSTNKGELAANLERNGLSTTFPESAIAFYGDRTWGQPGGLMFANPDGTLFVPEAGEVYNITYKYRAPLNNGNNMAINVVYGILDSFGDKTTTGDKTFFKSILDYNEIEEAVTEWTEKTISVTIPKEGEGYIPALGFRIDATKKVTVYEEDGTTVAGYDYTLVELDYVKVERVPTAIVTFVAADGTETSAKLAIGSEIKYPVLKATNNGDKIWSLSADEYIAAPAVLEDTITVYEFIVPTIGAENYYYAEYANLSLNVRATDELAYEGDYSIKFQNRGISYLKTQPADWETAWTNYYLIDENGVAAKLEGDVAPTFEPFKYANLRKGSQEHSVSLWNLPGGKSYKVSFKYYVPAELNTDVEIRPYTNMYNLWAPSPSHVSYPESRVTISKETETGKWLDGHFIFVNTALEGKDFLFLHVVGVGSNDNNDVVYFDNFTFEEVDNIGYIEFVDGETVTKGLYEEGDKISCPELPTDRNTDVVWSLSTEEYIPVPAIYSEPLTAYVYQSPVISFENYYKADFAKYSYNLVVGDDISVNGYKSMKYQNVGMTFTAKEPDGWAENWTKYYEIVDGEIVQLGGETAPVWKEYTYLEKRGNADESSIVLWNTPAGKAYKVSFKYFIPAELTTDITLTPYTNNANLWSPSHLEDGTPFGRVTYENSKFVFGADAAIGEWVEGEFYFVSAANDKADILYIGVGAAAVGNGDLIYFDDFTLTEVQYATFAIPEDASFEQGGVFADGVITVYAGLDEEIVAPLVIDAEGNPVDAWADAAGKVVDAFVNGGAYTMYVAPAFIYGDCNGDGAVDTTDLAALKLFLAGSGDAGEGADCDASGSVDTGDLASLKLFLAGTGNLGPAE